MGGMLWTPGDLRWTLNKGDAWDDKPGFEPGNQTDLVSCGLLTLRSLPVFDWLYLNDYEARLSLHDACAQVRTDSALGRAEVEAFCSAKDRVFCLRLEDDLGDAVAREFELSHFGSRSLDLLITKPGVYSGNASQRLAGTSAGAGGGGVWIEQQLSHVRFAVYAQLAGTGHDAVRTSSHAAVLRTIPARSGEYTFFASIVTSEESADPLAHARANVHAALARGWDAVYRDHRADWAQFWRKSFVHNSNDYFENLWYLFFYQLNSCSRGRYAPLFSGGLWLWNHDVRQWGGRYYHWNEQGVYWPVQAANHPELAEPYYRTYFSMIAGARASATRQGLNGVFFSDIANRLGEQREDSVSLTCNLTPGMQIALDFWRQYEYTRDRAFLSDRALPFLEEAVLFYLGILKVDPKGEYYVPSSCAYETPMPGDEIKLRNATPDIASIRAGFKAYLQGLGDLGRNSPLAARCGDVLRRLAPFVTYDDPNRGGEVFGRGYLPNSKVATDPVFRPDQSPVFPAGVIGLDQRGTPEFDIAVRTWRPGDRGVIGIWPESVVAARLGMADQAAQDLAVRADQLQIFPQGLFTDMGMRTQRFYAHNQSEGPPLRGWDAKPLSGGVFGSVRPVPVKPITQPFLESSGIFATTINEMLLQSHGGRIRVFPAIPQNWTGAFRLRAVGGFMVTAECDQGKTAYVLIESTAGGECVVANPWDTPSRVRRAADGQLVARASSGEIRFLTEPGAAYLMDREDNPVDSRSRTVFRRERNTAPKTFQHAILGRVRDF
jgi:hypothetical protein